MVQQRLALIVAVDRYADPSLRRLAAPTADAEALAEALSDPELGAFQVDVSVNESAQHIRERVETFFVDRRPDDLALLHFSCHGIKDDSGELFLASTDTRPKLLGSTAIDAAFVGRLMRRSRARRAVLLLDCCYGGAFERGMVPRDDDTVDVGRQFRQENAGGGRGRAVITASSAVEYAFEDTQLVGNPDVRPSLFTGALVEGVTTGKADRDQDGRVSLDELYDYVYDRVREQTPHQTPSKWVFGLEGDLIVARNPRLRIAPGSLPVELIEVMSHPLAASRFGAVHELGRIAAADNLPLAAAAREALARMTQDDSRRVSTAAAEALENTRLRLSTDQIDFGRVRVGDQVPVVEIGIEGPPLATASHATSSLPNAHVRRVDRSIHVQVDALTAGELDGVVTVAGPAGEATVAVRGVVERGATSSHGAAVVEQTPTEERPDAPEAMTPTAATATQPDPSPPSDTVDATPNETQRATADAADTAERAPTRKRADTAERAATSRQPTAATGASGRSAGAKRPTTQRTPDPVPSRRGRWAWPLRRSVIGGSIVVVVIGVLAAIAFSNRAGDGQQAAEAAGVAAAAIATSFTDPADIAGMDAMVAAFNERVGEGRVVHQPNTPVDEIISEGLDGSVSMALVGPPDIKFLYDRGAAEPLHFVDTGTIDDEYVQGTLQAGTIDGQLVGLPLRLGVKSLVWYRPDAFEEAGYEVPQTWSELLELTDQIRSDVGGEGLAPWCIGVESGDATGWVLTDWIEDLMLRLHSPDVYDRWIGHDIAFDSLEVATAFEDVGHIWFTDGNALRGREGIVETNWQDAAAPMFEDPAGCWMYRQGWFAPRFFPDDVEYGVDYDFFALPPVTDGSRRGNPLLVSGDLLVAFHDTSGVGDFIQFAASAEGQQAWASNGGMLCANANCDPSAYPDDALTKQSELLAEATSVRFDASDLMPPEVGTGSFWTEGTSWVAGTQQLGRTLRNIDDTWPEGACGIGGIGPNCPGDSS